MRTVAIVFAVLSFVAVPAYAGGHPGGSNNSRANSYRCKSGHTVMNAKACKENGGTR